MVAVGQAHFEGTGRRSDLEQCRRPARRGGDDPQRRGGLHALLGRQPPGERVSAASVQADAGLRTTAGGQRHRHRRALRTAQKKACFALQFDEQVGVEGPQRFGGGPRRGAEGLVDDEPATGSQAQDLAPEPGASDRCASNVQQHRRVRRRSTEQLAAASGVGGLAHTVRRVAAEPALDRRPELAAIGRVPRSGDPSAAIGPDGQPRLVGMLVRLAGKVRPVDDAVTGGDAGRIACRPDAVSRQRIERQRSLRRLADRWGWSCGYQRHLHPRIAVSRQRAVGAGQAGEEQLGQPQLLAPRHGHGQVVHLGQPHGLNEQHMAFKVIAG